MQKAILGILTTINKQRGMGEGQEERERETKIFFLLGECSIDEKKNRKENAENVTGEDCCRWI